MSKLLASFASLATFAALVATPAHAAPATKPAPAKPAPAKPAAPPAPGAKTPAPSGACGALTSPLADIDDAAAVVHVRLVPGSIQRADGGNSARVTVVETLRGSVEAGATLVAQRGGPCARDLSNAEELVLPLRDGTVDSGWGDQVPTSIALLRAVASTAKDDVAARAKVVVRAALAKPSANDLRSIMTYLAATPDVTAKISRADQKRLTRAFRAVDNAELQQQWATAIATWH